MIHKKKQYKGFSLIELLLTMMILGVISLLVGVTLNTIIRVSNSTNKKNLARNDVNYIMELIKRTVTNAQLDYVYLFDSEGSRTVSFQGNTISVTSAPTNFYENKEKVSGVPSNELHVKLYGYNTWYCFAYFTDGVSDDEGDLYGYVVQSIMSGDVYDKDPANCFGNLAQITVLHSLTMNVPLFNITYIDIDDGKNSIFDIEMHLEPLYWPLRQNALVHPTVQRRSVISTEALTWY